MTYSQRDEIQSLTGIIMGMQKATKAKTTNNPGQFKFNRYRARSETDRFAGIRITN